MTRTDASRLGALLWSATLVAGLIGVVRQRREAQQVRRGALPPDGPDGDRAPERPYRPSAAAISRWIPARPTTRAGRIATGLWCAPLTVIGLSVAALSGTRPQWDSARHCFVATGVGGPSRFALRLVGAGANTVGQVVLCTSDAPSPRLLDHEAVHVRQGERLGVLLVPAYLWLNALYGYRDNPLEHAARRGSRQMHALTSTRPDGD